MKDYIISATAFDSSVRIFAASTSILADEARKLHNSLPVASAALSRTLTAAAMLSGTLKNDNDLLTLIVKGDGSLGSVTVTANSRFEVKGYVSNPLCELPLKPNGKLNVRGAIGGGTLTVIRDMGLKEPYSGSIALVSGEIADDITYYFAKSEQIPTAVALGEIIDTDSSVKAAGGFIIQLLPGANGIIGDIIHDRLTQLPPISSLMSHGASPEDIIGMIFKDKDLIITAHYDTIYRCGCDRRKMEKGLISLGKKELGEIIREDKGAELCCHFCNKKYAFSEEELKCLSRSL